eukprot:6167780-Pyramimonas_sp.AAC.1
MRSRLAAQQVQCNSTEQNILAFTPPLEPQQLPFSMAVAGGPGHRRGKLDEGPELGLARARLRRGQGGHLHRVTSRRSSTRHARVTARVHARHQGYGQSLGRLLRIRA